MYHSISRGLNAVEIGFPLQEREDTVEKRHNSTAALCQGNEDAVDLLLHCVTVSLTLSMFDHGSIHWVVVPGSADAKLEWYLINKC